MTIFSPPLYKQMAAPKCECIYEGHEAVGQMEKLIEVFSPTMIIPFPVMFDHDTSFHRSQPEHQFCY